MPHKQDPRMTTSKTTTTTSKTTITESTEDKDVLLLCVFDERPEFRNARGPRDTCWGIRHGSGNRAQAHHPARLVTHEEGPSHEVLPPALVRHILQRQHNQDSNPCWQVQGPIVQRQGSPLRRWHRQHIQRCLRTPLHRTQCIQNRMHVPAETRKPLAVAHTPPAAARSPAPAGTRRSAAPGARSTWSPGAARARAGRGEGRPRRARGRRSRPCWTAQGRAW
mmetsp:Transcript_4196/g.14183  ORF Transcript_4196/g.14183 Transcript_4196/m.14183 type:complete len:222 (-) Transcript_4196:1666-2331(-)